MKNLNMVLVLIVSSLFLLNVGAGGDVVNNGGGASELTVVYAAQNYSSLTEICSRTTSCGLIEDEEKLLQTLITSWHQEKGVALIFQTRSVLNEDLFRTGQRTGAPVEINKDLLWKMDATGRIESYQLSNALELLTLAWGQHHPQFRFSTVESLARKISNHALVGKSMYLPYLRSLNVRLLTVQDSEMDQMYIEDGFDSFLELHPQILTLLPCRPIEFSIFAFQWSPMEIREEAAVRVLANGRIGWKCEEDGPFQKASLSISFKATPAVGSLQDYLTEGKTALKMADQTIEMNLSNSNSTR